MSEWWQKEYKAIQRLESREYIEYEKHTERPLCTKCGKPYVKTRDGQEMCIFCIRLKLK